MGSQSLVHVFLVSFPGQGHINPLLRLGKRLASRGLLVTLSSTEPIGKIIRKASNITDELIAVGDGFIRFEFFKDGLSENDPKRFNLDLYLPQLEKAGKEQIPKILKKHAELGQPVSCLINNPFLPWVCDVAESLGLPSAMLWVQSCACFSCFYHYYHGLVPFPSENQMEIDVKLPCMPLLKRDEIPTFLLPTTPYPFFRRAILEQYKNLSTPFCILMDTFQELENDVIEHMSKMFPVKPIGPLFKNPKDVNSNVKVDFVKAADGCIDWLDTKEKGTIVYVSFGSVVSLKQEQMEEIALGLLNANVSFLWVVRVPLVRPEGFLDKVGDKAKVVNWCSQEQVLAHPSVACFVTHCGWNSVIESLTSGVPVVAFPQWGDQVTNAKYLVDVFKTGIRLSRGEAEDGIIPCDEVEKCIREALFSEKAAEMKSNALKWKKAAEEAIAVGGSSDRNIQEFVYEICQRSVGLNTRLSTVLTI